MKYDTAVGRLRQVASDLAGHASWGESVLGGDSGAPVLLLNDAHGVLSGCIGTGDHNDDWIDTAIDYPLRDLSLHLLKKKKP